MLEKSFPMLDTAFWLQAGNRPDAALPPLHFVHGNSFPTGSYRMLLQALRADYQIHALELHGHDPAFPVTDGWPNLCQELIKSIEARQTAPVILLGHSLGGMLSLMVASLRPDLIRCVVMLDSPVVAGWRAGVLRVAKWFRLEQIFGPARFSRRRRKSWPGQEAAYQHFAIKPAFGIWPQQVLRDYIKFGTMPYPKGVTLRFNREVETAIYCSLPHDIVSYIPTPFPVPVGFICGTGSAECQQAGIAHTKALVGSNFEWMEGSHLYALESPELTAQKVHGIILKLMA